MDPLEIQLRSCTRSVRAVVGAAGLSALLFLVMASTTIVIHRPEETAEPPLTYAIAPPPPPLPPKQRTTPPLSSSLTESFKFDPTTASPSAPIPLEALEISLDPGIDVSTAVAFELQRPFTVPKPPVIAPLVILERSRVDELPVWMSGPDPRAPSGFDYADWRVLVLYPISAKGEPGQVFVLDAPDPSLHEPVIRAISQWVFRPAKLQGKPVNVWVQQLIESKAGSKSPFEI